MRLIDADALLQQLDNEQLLLNARGQMKEYMFTQNLRDVVEEFPTVEFQRVDYNNINGAITFRPANTGIWKRKSDETSYWYECSECEERPLKERWSREDCLSKFCPHCGAKMRTEVIE